MVAGGGSNESVALSVRVCILRLVGHLQLGCL